MVRKKISKIAFTVMGKDWVLCLVTWRKYRKMEKEDTIAVCHGHSRKVYLSPGGRGFEDIKHELWHAYIHECCVTSASGLGADDMEEISADLFSFRGAEILEKAADLHKKVMLANGQ